MRTRRTIMSSVLALVGAGGAAGVAAKMSAGSGAATSSSDATYPGARSESPATGATQKVSFAAGDVRRYGLVPNNPTAATENTRALAALVSPAGTFAGGIWFPNTSGKDIYYLN